MQAMCRDYYTLDFMDRSVDTSPIAPALATFFDDVLDRSVSQLNFKVAASSVALQSNHVASLRIVYAGLHCQGH